MQSPAVHMKKIFILKVNNHYLLGGGTLHLCKAVMKKIVLLLA